MTLLFLNHTPYKEFWTPIREHLGSIPSKEFPFCEFWERTGSFRAWEEYKPDPNSPPVWVAHSHGCTFLPQVREFFALNQNLPTCWINPELQPLFRNVDNPVEEVRGRDADEILQKYSDFVNSGSVKSSRAVEEFTGAFHNSLNYSKALMLEHADLCSSPDEKFLSNFQFGPTLFLLRELESEAENSTYGRIGLRSFHSLPESRIEVIPELDPFPFQENTLESLLFHLENFYFKVSRSCE